jgi:hypothetical protein
MIKVNATGSYTQNMLQCDVRSLILEIMELAILIAEYVQFTL